MQEQRYWKRLLVKDGFGPKIRPELVDGVWTLVDPWIPLSADMPTPDLQTEPTRVVNYEFLEAYVNYIVGEYNRTAAGMPRAKYIFCRKDRVSIGEPNGSPAETPLYYARTGGLQVYVSGILQLEGRDYFETGEAERESRQIRWGKAIPNGAEITFAVFDAGRQGYKKGPLRFITEQVDGARAGEPYQFWFEAEGGEGIHVWKDGGGIPAGFILSPMTGGLSGQSDTVGIYTIRIGVNDGITTIWKDFEFSVGSELELRDTKIPNVPVHTDWSYTFHPFGGAPPYSFSGSNLPPGLGFDGWKLKGWCPSKGSWTTRIRLEDSEGSIIERDFQIRVVDPLIAVAGVFPKGWVTRPYSARLHVTGGVPPYTWTTDSELPPGLRLEESSVIGIPELAGEWTMVFTVTDDEGTEASTEATVQILDGLSPPSLIEDGFFPDCIVGRTYIYQLHAMGGQEPYVFYDEGLPLGLYMTDIGCGRITGTTMAEGEYDVYVKVTDHDGVYADGWMTLKSVSDIEIKTESLPSCVMNQIYPETRLEFTGGNWPNDWSMQNAPLGLECTDRGIIRGIPLRSGIFNVIIRLTDAFGVYREKEIELVIPEA